MTILLNRWQIPTKGGKAPSGVGVKISAYSNSAHSVLQQGSRFLKRKIVYATRVH